MQDWESMSHVRWECKYHVVFIPKYRHKVFYGRARSRVGPILSRCHQIQLSIWPSESCCQISSLSV